MTIAGWILFGVCVFIGIFIGFAVYINHDSTIAGVITAVLIIGISLGGLLFFFNGTASGRRALVDQRSELQNGLDREINVYTANGDLIAHYEGRIDLEDNEGGYVIFDYNGRRYTYYNCFVESIADID